MALEVVLFTSPEMRSGEVEMVHQMFQSGLVRLHLRRPGASLAEVWRFISQIPREFHPRIVLHSQHVLATCFQLGGVHLTSAARKSWSKRLLAKIVRWIRGGAYTTSWHLGDDSKATLPFTYGFLSPLYPSVSKPGYGGSCSAIEVTQFLLNSQVPVYALGGVTVEKLQEVHNQGFRGVGILGAVWQSHNPLAAFLDIQRRCQAL